MEKSKIEIYGSDVYLEDLSEMSREDQIETMKAWFYENFEDPAEHTPYESAEGGYIFICGGPYDAFEELSFFQDFVPEDVVEELAEDLSGECPEWAGVSKATDYEEDYINLIVADNEFYKSFKESLNHITQLVQTKVEGDTKHHLLGLLHVSVITAMETYVSDAFINIVLSDRALLKKFVETNPEFSKRVFKLSEIFSTYEKIEFEVKQYLLSIMWHNLHKVKPLYKTTLNIEFPEKEIVTEVFLAISKRHDFVHRNGKDTNGEPVVITENSLNDLLNTAAKFIDFINDQIHEKYIDEYEF